MDTQNYVKIASYAHLANLRNRKVVVGAKQLRKALQKGVVAQVFLAENADPALTQPIMDLCVSCGAEYFWVRTMSELGSACGIDVGAAAAAVVG